MSASQARLLSITSRLTNNEFRAQTITNSKLRLAEKSQEASQEYMDALNSKKLMYGVFNSDGEREYSNLTANTLLSYGRLKNQYSLVNANGQILLSGSDIKNYENSTTMAEFLKKYGVKDAENPQYANTLNAIFGQKYADFFNEAYPNSWTNDPANGNNLAYLGNIEGELTNIYKNIDTISATAYNNDINTYLGNLNAAGIVPNVDTGGIFTNFINVLNSIPEYVPEPTLPDLMNYAKDLLSPQCWTATGINDLRIGKTLAEIEKHYEKYYFDLGQPNQCTVNKSVWHMEHVLGQYFFSSSADEITVNINGTNEKIENKSISTTDAPTMTSGGGNGNDPMNVRGVLNKSENADLKQRLQELYYNVCLHVDSTKERGGLTRGTITNNGMHDVMDAEDIAKLYLGLMNDLLKVMAKDLLDARENNPSDPRLSDAGVIKFFEDYDAANVQYAADNVKRNAFITQFTNWLDNAKDTIDNFKKQIASIPSKMIPDETDEKYQWYVNLWYRMGGGERTAQGKVDNSGYQEIDENLINNAEWLEFCFEHGVLTLEQAQFNEKGSATYPGMGQYDWVSTVYTNSSDIISQEDEVAIAIAEVKYKNRITEIENEDKKFDQDLKKLDTEHTALQTEYDSIKEVINKNVERSFKAFS